jgi:hypothetical protein
MFWGENPMKRDDVTAFPNHLVSSLTNPELNAALKAHGIRQMFFMSAEGEERLFPDYAVAPNDRLLQRQKEVVPRVAQAISNIQTDLARRDADLMGVVVAGWADSGLHPETFWLGYATIAAAAWNPVASEARSASTDFYQLFYGPSVVHMERVYQLMSTQAQFWSDSWDRVESTSRKGVWGNSHSIFPTRRPAFDQTLPLPTAPNDGTLSVDKEWSQRNARRLALIEHYRLENDELCGLLHENLRRIEYNHHNVEVMLSIAALCRQNLTLIDDINSINDLVVSAHKAAHDNKVQQCIAQLDQALNLAHKLVDERDTVLKNTVATWYKTWCPRVASANGRTFVHEVDDVKDHLPDRTVGMEYLILRQLLLPMGGWIEHIQGARNAYAQAQQLPLRTEVFQWQIK